MSLLWASRTDIFICIKCWKCLYNLIYMYSNSTVSIANNIDNNCNILLLLIHPKLYASWLATPTQPNLHIARTMAHCFTTSCSRLSLHSSNPIECVPVYKTIISLACACRSCGLYEPTMMTARLVRKSREIDDGLSDLKSQLDILMRDITNKL